MSSRPLPLWAAELQAELDAFPDDRGEILLEVAQDYQRANEIGPAIELLNLAIETGDENAALARVVLAEVLFDSDRTDDAWAQLRTLLRDRIASPMPYHLAAELLEERGDLEPALTWFNIAVSRLRGEDLADRSAALGTFSYANSVFAGRARVRRALGMPTDEFDESVEFLARRADEILRESTPQQEPRSVRVLFWPRPEVPLANGMWPELVGAANDDAGFRQREASNRELAESGISEITMVPLTVAKLVDYAMRTGADPMDSDTRLACIGEIVSEGKVIAWPPPRNAPCWCGSAAMYKKCCGRPMGD